MENFIETHKEDLIEIVRGILKIKSVEDKQVGDTPFGKGVKEALQFALKTGKEMGFKTKNLDNYAGYVEYGKGNELISILGHLDVVPEGKGWTHPPYGAEIEDGKIYARGASDDKGPIMAALFGLYAVKEMKIPLKKRVRIIFGTNEETGWKGINYYKQHEKEPLIGFTPDGDFPVVNREKGILNISLAKTFASSNTDVIINGGERPNMVPGYAEADIKNLPDNLSLPENVTISGNKIIAKGISAHAAHPWKGKNAIVLLCKALARLDINKDVKSIINFILDKVSDVYGEKLGIAFEDKPSGRLTLNLGILKVNETKGEMTFNIRYPITDKAGRIVKNIGKEAEKYGLMVQNTSDLKPLFVKEEEPLVQKLLSVYEEETGEKAYTMAIGGGTYARAMEKGVAFGPVFPNTKSVEHQPDEYIAINDLVKLAKIYARAIQKLAE